MTDTDVRFESTLRCKNCDTPLAYILSVSDKSVLALYDEQGTRQFVYRSSMRCGYCGAEREFAS